MGRSDDPVRETETEESEAVRGVSIVRAAWIFYPALALAGVVWLRIAEGSLSPDLFFDPATPLLDVALGIGCGGVLLGGWRFFRRLSASLRALEAVMRRWLGPLDAPQVFGLALISGCAEELFFRGALQSSLGWVWATLIFALLHSGPGKVFRIWTVFALVAGLLFAALTQYRGNILAATVAHFLVNWINLHTLASVSDIPNSSS